MIDEIALLRRARQFDEEALAEIYDTLSPAIYAYAMRILGDADLAEECIADTFSRFLNALHAGGGPQDYLKAYLYRVAHNWITDRFRHNRPETSLEQEIDLPAGQETEPHNTVADEIERQELRQALALLTPEQRQVITLKYLENLDNAEIAHSLQKPVGAVKSLQHRALATLRRILESNEPLLEEHPVRKVTDKRESTT
jgi:RNA polymerase sigma-70 factor (ECF subfamily)